MRREQEERRCKERVTLRCTIHVFGEGAPGVDAGVDAGVELGVIRATTANVSSRGLYCHSDVEIPAGKRLRCLIELTPDGFRASAGPLCLECFLEVVRSERVSAGYGAGCRIHKYRLMRPECPDLQPLEYATDGSEGKRL